MIGCIETYHAHHWASLRKPDGTPLLSAPLAELLLEHENAKQHARGAHRGARHARPRRTHPDLAVPALVNHGFWKAFCPFCQGGVIVALSDPRLICLTVGCNAGGPNGANGDAISLLLPPPLRIQQIETLLLLRPRLVNRSWEPHETVSDLIRENREHDIDMAPRKLAEVYRQTMPHWLALFGSAAEQIRELPIERWED